MKGIILINAFSGIGEHQATRLREEFGNLGVDVPIVKNLPGNLPEDIDFCICLDKDIYTARALENRGVRLFNRASAIEICDDKMLTYLALDGKVAQPKTIPCAFSYVDSIARDAELDYIVDALGLPLILKINKHSRGEGVFLVESKDELKELVERYRTLPHIYQKYISYARGVDTRVIVVGRKVVAAMERKNLSDYRSNVEQGGVGRKINVSEKMANIAVKVADILNLDYCGIDFLTDENGDYYVCEVNSNAFFKGIESVSGVSVAHHYCKHVLESIGQ